MEIAPWFEYLSAITGNVTCFSGNCTAYTCFQMANGWNFDRRFGKTLPKLETLLHFSLTPSTSYPSILLRPLVQPVWLPSSLEQHPEWLNCPQCPREPQHLPPKA